MTRTEETVRSTNLPTLRGQRIRLPERLASDDEQEAWQTAVSHTDAMVAIDLFCGAGGMSLGFEDAGFVVAAGFDSDPVACETHAANLLSKTKCINLGAKTDPAELMKEMDIPRVDVIVGGPPCQGFSRAGLSKLRHLQAQDPRVRAEIESRNALYKEFVHFVRVLQPLFFVMENVPDLHSYADGIIAAEIRRDFAEAGYSADPVFLDASQFGVPQSRRRLFFIGSRVGRIWRLPRARFRYHPRTLLDAIGDLPAIDAPSLHEQLPYAGTDSNEYQALMRSRVLPEERDYVYDHIVRAVREDDLEIFRRMQPGQKYIDVPEEYRRYRWDAFKDKYYRLRRDIPCNTITAHIAKDGYRYIHPEQHRTLSVREAARVQSFPDHFRFAGHRSNRYIQIGNAVPPLLAHAIGLALKGAIQRYRIMARGGEVSLIDPTSDEEDFLQAALPGIDGTDLYTGPPASSGLIRSNSDGDAVALVGSTDEVITPRRTS